MVRLPDLAWLPRLLGAALNSPPGLDAECGVAVVAAVTD